MNRFDVAVIGAGPSGSVVSALLNKKGYRVCVLEKQYFPRFVIGESLLPHCMEFLDEAGMLDALKTEPDFQFKNGAAFTWGERYTEIDFTDKFTSGPGTTFQVKRASFDKILIDEAQRQGVTVRYGQTVENVIFTDDGVTLNVQPQEGDLYTVEARFVLDASGYGRILPRLLDLEIPSHLPERMAYFTHIDDNIATDNPEFDRNKILICTHPQWRDVWLWFIPFADGRTSIGVVGTPERIIRPDSEGAEATLKKFASEIPRLQRLLTNAVWDNEVPFRTLRSYSANVKTLYGTRFALLGNATEFLDPVFSSGVTIALHSSHLAAHVLDKELKGEKPNWQREYADQLMIGVNAFRTYVDGWYSTTFQDVLYAKETNPDIRRMIASILAGYAWDTENPFVSKSDRRLAALAEICGPASLISS